MRALLLKYKYQLLAVAIFLAHLIISYWGVIRFRYPVPPGDDTISHLASISQLQKAPVLWPTGEYPPGFHYLVIGLSKIFGRSPIGVMTVFWPALVVMSGLGVYYLSRKFFGKKIGLLTYALFALVCLQPLQTAYDGGFPNILATGVFLTLNIVCWAELWKQFRLKWLLGFILTGVLMIYTHHLTTIVWLVLITVSGIILSVIKIIQLQGRARYTMLIGTLVIMAVTYWLYKDTIVFASAKNLAAFGVSGAESPVLALSAYSVALTGLVFEFSFIGAGFAAWEIITNKFRGKATTLIILLTWYGLYLIGSRMSFVVEPDRLVRDLSLPATMLSAYGIASVYRLVGVNKFLAIVFIVCVSLLVVAGFADKTKYQLKYSGMIRYSTADEQALQYIDAHPTYPYLVWAQNSFWQYMAVPEIASGKVVLINKYQVDQLYQGDSCLLAGYYQPGIWQDFLQDQTIANRFRTDPRVSTKLLSEDQNKIWYLFCLK